MTWWFKLLIVVNLTNLQTAFAQDLFPDGTARDIPRLTVLASGTTIGGYALYDGGRTWKLISNKASANNMNIRIGSAQMISPIGGDYFAEMNVATAMGGGSESGYFSADICNAGTAHLYMVNLGAGTRDNCLTIDPYLATINNKGITTLAIKIRNAQSNWRLYDMRLLLNLSLMGFPGTSTSDWGELSVSTDPKKKRFVTKVSTWAKQLQEAVNTAIGFSKPKDAFAGVPPISTLIEANSEPESTLPAQEKVQ